MASSFYMEFFQLYSYSKRRIWNVNKELFVILIRKRWVLVKRSNLVVKGGSRFTITSSRTHNILLSYTCKQSASTFFLSCTIGHHYNLKFNGATSML